MSKGAYRRHALDHYPFVPKPFSGIRCRSNGEACCPWKEPIQARNMIVLPHVNRWRRRPRCFLPQLAHRSQRYELAPVQEGEELQEDLGAERLHPGRTVGYRRWWGLSAIVRCAVRKDDFPSLLGWRSTCSGFRHEADRNSRRAERMRQDRGGGVPIGSPK